MRRKKLDRRETRRFYVSASRPFNIYAWRLTTIATANVRSDWCVPAVAVLLACWWRKIDDDDWTCDKDGEWREARSRKKEKLRQSKNAAERHITYHEEMNGAERKSREHVKIAKNNSMQFAVRVWLDPLWIKFLRLSTKTGNDCDESNDRLSWLTTHCRPVHRLPSLRKKKCSSACGKHKVDRFSDWTWKLRKQFFVVCRDMWSVEMSWKYFAIENSNMRLKRRKVSIWMTNQFVDLEVVFTLAWLSAESGKSWKSVWFKFLNLLRFAF